MWITVFVYIFLGSCKQEENQYFNDNDSKFVLFDDRYSLKDRSTVLSDHCIFDSVDNSKENIDINAKLKRSDDV